MATPSTIHRPSPEKIFNALNAYQQTATLKAAHQRQQPSALACS
jgi:hypothetical protein